MKEISILYFSSDNQLVSIIQFDTSAIHARYLKIPFLNATSITISLAMNQKFIS